MSKCLQSEVHGFDFCLVSFVQSEPEVVKRTLELTVLSGDVKFLRHLISNQSLDVNGKPKILLLGTHIHMHTHTYDAHTCM